jgi:cyanophycinase
MSLGTAARCALSAAMVLVGGCVALPPAADDTRPGSLVIVGGALRFADPEVWSRMVELAGGKGAKVAVIPTAGGDPKQNAGPIVAAFERYGADATLIPLSLDAKRMDGLDYKQVREDPRWVDQVKGSSLVYFIGGAQERIVKALYEDDGGRSPMLQAIWEVYRSGGVVGGSSAGAAIMSDPMVRDTQDVFQVLRNGARYWDVLQGDPPHGEETTRGLGFIREGWFVDQHFLIRGRLARALAVMRDRAMRYGLGVDENTAVVVTGGAEAEVIGYKGALLVDLAQATFDEGQRLFNVTNAKLSYLERGDRLDLETLAITPSPEKNGGRKIDPNDRAYRPRHTDPAWYADVLGNTTVVDLMANLIDNKQAEVIGLAFAGNPAIDHQSIGWEFKFYKGSDSLGYSTAAQGGSDYSVYNIHLDVEPVRMAERLYEPMKVSGQRCC